MAARELRSRFPQLFFCCVTHLAGGLLLIVSLITATVPDAVISAIPIPVALATTREELMLILMPYRYFPLSVSAGLVGIAYTLSFMLHFRSQGFLPLPPDMDGGHSANRS